MSDAANGHSVFVCNNGMKKPETQKIHLSRDSLLGGDLWTDGLICAFEFVRGHKKMVKSKPGSKVEPSLTPKVNGFSLSKSSPVIESAITIKDKFDEHDFSEDCHVGHLNGRENFLPRSYWIPIGWDRISQLVQSVQIDAGWNEQPFDFPSEEDDVTVADLAAPYWERPVGPTWWCHVAADHPHINAWHEKAVILPCIWNHNPSKLFRKSIFGAADEIELKFMNRRTHEDMHLVGIILNQEIRRLSTQVIRVKWSLHARDEIVFELLQHLKGNLARALLERMRKSTREMIEEQEAVRGRLFTIQDVMQSTVRAWLQRVSICICIVLWILFLLGVVLIAIGLLYLGLKKPILDEHVEVRKLELEELVKMFEQEAESHAQVRKSVPHSTLPPTVADLLPDGASYVLIS
ncbi:hypothetical protein WN944_019447 [Citrus x changshan-huyou]|uniref:Uncharacterized protein n=1 Tax=Citrus x changshan-huyou TaxID=2935761 RepID=A0AAP0LV95_9ROSI